ncbi:hypothetical protein D3C72_1448240 [compost metagenome]
MLQRVFRIAPVLVQQTLRQRITFGIDAAQGGCHVVIMQRQVARRASDIHAGFRGDDIGELLPARVLHAYTSGSVEPVRVKISKPVSVTASECSNCADSERSFVTVVHLSGKTLTW